MWYMVQLFPDKALPKELCYKKGLTIEKMQLCLLWFLEALILKIDFRPVLSSNLVFSTHCSLEHSKIDPG